MTDWDLLARVKSSRYREVILLALEAPLRPTDLQHSTGLDRGHVSRTLRELADLGLAECLTPETRKYRLYRRTTAGDRVVKELHHV